MHLRYDSGMSRPRRWSASREIASAAVAAQVGPYEPCGCTIEERTRALLLASLAKGVALYALEKWAGSSVAISGAPGRRRGRGPRHDCPGLGGKHDHPGRVLMVNVRDIESGKVRATLELFGAD